MVGVRNGFPLFVFIETILEATGLFPKGVQLGVEEAIGIAVGDPGGYGMKVVCNGAQL